MKRLQCVGVLSTFVGGWGWAGAFGDILVTCMGTWGSLCCTKSLWCASALTCCWTPTATWHPHSVRVAFYNWHSDRSWRLWVVALWVAKMRHHVEILVYRARGLKSIFIPPCPPIAAPTNSSSSVQSWWVNAANSQPLDGPVDTSIPTKPPFHPFTQRVSLSFQMSDAATHEEIHNVFLVEKY